MKTGSLQCGGSCVLCTVVLLHRTCINLLLTPSVCALTSAKAFLRFVIIGNFMLIVESVINLEEYYFCVTHFKSPCISSQSVAPS